MVKELNVWDAVRRKEEMAELPAGFSAFQSTTGKYWDIYFKYHITSNPQIIQFSLTEKKAKSKAQLLNSVLITK
jgi:hypothetical protein